MHGFNKLPLDLVFLSHFKTELLKPELLKTELLSVATVATKESWLRAIMAGESMMGSVWESW
jgi:hypothetical protein